MATIDARLGQIRDRSARYPEICYTVGKKSKTFLKECLKAHEAIIEVMPPQVRMGLTNATMKATTLAYVSLDTDARKELLQRMIFANFGTTRHQSATLDALAEAWLSSKSAQGASPAMVKTMVHQKNVLTDFFKSARLTTTADLTPQTAVEFLAWRPGIKYNKHKVGPVSASAMRHELQALRQMAKLAHRNGWIDNDRIWDDVQVRSIVGQNTKAVEPLSPEEQMAILRALYEHPGAQAMHDAALLLLITGMRASELDTLTPSSIVSGTLQLHGQSVGRNKPTTGKTATAERILPVCPTIETIFKRGHIFGYKAELMQRNMARGWFLEMHPGVHAHRLRHTFAVNKLLSGVADLKMVQYQLGHADISTTANLYGKFAPEHFKAGFDKIKEARNELINMLESDYFGDGIAICTLKN